MNRHFVVLALVGSTLTAPTPAQKPNYPIEAVLSAARDLCAVDVPVTEGVAAFERAGWRTVTPEPESWLAQQVAEHWGGFGRGFTVSHTELTGSIEGRQMFAILGELSFEHGPPTRICEVYDPAANASFDVKRLEGWAGHAISNRLEAQAPRAVHAHWAPGLSRNSDSTDVVYFGPASNNPLLGSIEGLTYSVSAKAKAPTK